MNLELVVRQGDQPGRIFLIADGDRKTVGRAPECDIRLPDQGVSRKHCTVENLGQRLEVIDLQSANGSFINGELVERGFLGPGDELAVGPAVLTCRIREESRVARAPGEATLAYREEGTMTVLRKRIDTQFPGMAAAGADRWGDIETLERAQRNLATAYRVSKLLSSARNLEGLFEGIIDSIFAALNADRAALLLEDGDELAGDLKVVTARARSFTQQPQEIAAGFGPVCFPGVHLEQLRPRDASEIGVASDELARHHHGNFQDVNG